MDDPWFMVTPWFMVQCLGSTDPKVGILAAGSRAPGDRPRTTGMGFFMQGIRLSKWFLLLVPLTMTYDANMEHRVFMF